MFFICNCKQPENQLLILFYAYLCNIYAYLCIKNCTKSAKVCNFTQKSHFSDPKITFCQKLDSETADAKGLRTSTICNTLDASVYGQAPHVKKLLPAPSNEATLKFFFIFCPTTHRIFFYFSSPITRLVMCFRF